ncbi:hypothetical protein BO99DRAFT_416902 [Aspergillus violaceofuscus CBS 115571]|uniref:Uncharacterized protein n=1 Tax=Aspergillus violaceofuscus (strain CBS 115571) TaxID=1450538 RepID=A0A2V5GTQ0_ASPV1|nr:hypothetical protein BO99DRAFT_416902 [Aspergillus violaceofuscus CBS 115571]
MKLATLAITVLLGTSTATAWELRANGQKWTGTKPQGLHHCQHPQRCKDQLVGIIWSSDTAVQMEFTMRNIYIMAGLIDASQAGLITEPFPFVKRVSRRAKYSNAVDILSILGRLMPSEDMRVEQTPVLKAMGNLPTATERVVAPVGGVESGALRPMTPIPWGRGCFPSSLLEQISEIVNADTSDLHGLDPDIANGIANVLPYHDFAILICTPEHHLPLRGGYLPHLLQLVLQKKSGGI